MVRLTIMVSIAFMASMASMATWIAMHRDREAAGLPEWRIDATLLSPNFSSFVVSRRDPDIDGRLGLDAVRLTPTRGGGTEDGLQRGQDMPNQPPPPPESHGKGRRACMGKGQGMGTKRDKADCYRASRSALGRLGRLSVEPTCR